MCMQCFSFLRICFESLSFGFGFYSRDERVIRSIKGKWADVIGGLITGKKWAKSDLYYYYDFVLYILYYIIYTHIVYMCVYMYYYY